MKALTRSILAAAALSTLTVAGAAQADGFYIGAGVYQSEADYENYDSSDTVPAAFIGYNFLDTNILMMSVEAGYYDLGDYSKKGVDVESDAFTLAAVAYLPIGPFFEVYAKAGMASMSVDVGDKDYDGEEAFGGVGVGFDILDTIDIYAEYLVFDNEIDSEMAGVGIRFDF